MPFVIALLAFAVVFVLIAGLWWSFEGRRRVLERLRLGAFDPGGDVQILRTDLGEVQEAGGRPSLYDRLALLCVQAEYPGAPSDIPLLVGLCAVAAALLAWLRTGGLWLPLVAAPMGAAVPIIYLVTKRQRRLARFDQAFPGALEAMSGLIRAGNALSGAFRIMGEDLPDPIGPEFRRVSEQTRLGMEAGEALSRLAERVPTDDVRFFCTAIRIQRATGGNLAEILDRLSEVIRERFKILSHARVLSSQHRWSAILVGLSPIGFAVAFQILNPGYFDPLMKSEYWPMLLGAGLVLEAIGFFLIWRIAQIEV